MLIEAITTISERLRYFIYAGLIAVLATDQLLRLRKHNALY